MKWFRDWRNERRWAVAVLQRFWRYGLSRLAIRNVLDLAHIKRMNDRRYVRRVFVGCWPVHVQRSE